MSFIQSFWFLVQDSNPRSNISFDRLRTPSEVEGQYPKENAVIARTLSLSKGTWQSGKH